MKNFISKRMETVVPYKWGLQSQDPTIIKLNTNENPYLPAPGIKKVLTDFDMSLLQKYPDPTGGGLREKLAEAYGTKACEVFLGNGSDDILSHAFLAFFDENDTVLVPSISYGLYPVLADLYKVKLVNIPLMEDLSLNFSAFLTNTAPILIANPNAPTGLFLTSMQIEKLLDKNPNQLVILDEAYIDFAPESMVKFVEKYKNLLVIQTSSKSRNLAGLRLGWAFGSEQLIKVLNAVRDCINPYNVDTIAIKIGDATLSDPTYFEAITTKIIATRELFTVKLRELGFCVVSSSANFVLTSHPNICSKKLYEMLLEKKIVVRYFELAGHGKYNRISIGTDEQTDYVLKILQQILEEEK
ncbi:histidinol-phosphate aminotransferase [Erysipelotrichaceae bacterium]|nr:histidinol-phosphate aminotransferase [Erysipelotrichaceae bacterium]